MFVKRNAAGRVCAVSLEPTAEIHEKISADSPELRQFIGAGEESHETDLDTLQASDLALVRVLEDLIDVLIDKNLIQFTDLPPMAQQKLLSRQGLRRQHRLELLGDDNSDEEQIPMP
ncbi:tryptophan synthase subunit beta like protein [Oceanimonas pelagia]|uniref:Tryptophan synthase subunit beta like protein n=1 Tax=Oceanimonas pelagia TaxID=3028314 RepID=A0AA50KQ89_9GAMM|nr:tryptophan synthase subunit beta like protein [Oceanimonas pelagia]WMC11223.1 tryptophan synthase subunit beta like protein [Oceanimonas pelagia]